MKYRYITQRVDYSHYASGKIFVSAPGFPAFPVRLATEIFLRCVKILSEMGKPGPFHVYDPCCGGAYLLSTLAYFNWKHISSISASDVDENALSYARRNLALLSMDGLDRRIAEVTEMRDLYGKDSHAYAVESGLALKERLQENLQDHIIQSALFRADATDRKAVQAAIPSRSVDIVIMDVPYGLHSDWVFDPLSAEAPPDPVDALLDTLTGVVAPQSVVAIIASKDYSVHHPSYSSAGRHKIGARQIWMMSPNF